MAKLDGLRDENGKLPAHAWPGGYPLYYVCADNEVMCAACANGENGSIASENNDESQWKLVAYDVYWEGPPITCSHCNAQIESAYGDPDVPDDDTDDDT